MYTHPRAGPSGLDQETSSLGQRGDTSGLCPSALETPTVEHGHQLCQTSGFGENPRGCGSTSFTETLRSLERSDGLAPCMTESSTSARIKLELSSSNWPILHPNLNSPDPTDFLGGGGLRSAQHWLHFCTEPWRSATMEYV